MPRLGVFAPRGEPRSAARARPGTCSRGARRCCPAAPCSAGAAAGTPAATPSPPRRRSGRCLRGFTDGPPAHSPAPPARLGAAAEPGALRRNDAAGAKGGRPVEVWPNEPLGVWPRRAYLFPGTWEMVKETAALRGTGGGGPRDTRSMRTGLQSGALWFSGV